MEGPVSNQDYFFKTSIYKAPLIIIPRTELTAAENDSFEIRSRRWAGEHFKPTLNHQNRNGDAEAL